MSCIINSPGREAHQISSDADNRMEPKNQNQKTISRVSKKKLKKSLDQNLTPKESHAEFPGLKNFQKALNKIT